MVYGAPYKGETEGQIDRTAKSEVFEHRKPLIVIHRKNGVTLLKLFLGKSGIGRNGAQQSHPSASQLFDNGPHHINLLIAQVTIFTRMGIETTDGDGGLFNAVLLLQTLMEDLNDLKQ